MAAECATSRFSSRNRAERHLLQAFEMKKEKQETRSSASPENRKNGSVKQLWSETQKACSNCTIEFSLPGSRLTHPLFQLPYIAPTVFRHRSPPRHTASTTRAPNREKKLDFTKGKRDFEHHQTPTTRQEHHMYVCMYLSLSVCVYVCMYVCMYPSIS